MRAIKVIGFYMGSFKCRKCFFTCYCAPPLISICNKDLKCTLTDSGLYDLLLAITILGAFLGIIIEALQSKFFLNYFIQQ